VLEQGQIPLDNPIADWFSNKYWYQNLGHEADQITVRMLLNHTSGIPDHRQSPQFHKAISANLTSSPPNYGLYFSPEELIGFSGKQTLDFVPGSAFNYSETGFIIAGLLIELLAQTDFYELVQRWFIDPLELTNTTPAVWGNEHHLAQGYVDTKSMPFPQLTLNRGKLIINPASEWTGGGFISNTSDLARWARVLYRGEALSMVYLDTMVSSVDAGNSYPRYGLGCYLWNSDYGLLYGHSGEAPGYRSIMAYSPDLELSLSIQINTSTPDHAVLNTLLNTALQAIVAS